jgi:predicted ABC-type sugar transport system permease subunit
VDAFYQFIAAGRVIILAATVEVIQTNNTRYG